MSADSLALRLSVLLRCREDEVASSVERLVLAKETADKKAEDAESEAKQVKGRFGKALAKLGLADSDKLEEELDAKMAEHKTLGEEYKKVRAAVKALADAEESDAKAEAEKIAASRGMASDAGFIGYVLAKRQAASIVLSDGARLADPEKLTAFRAEFALPNDGKPRGQAPAYATQVLASTPAGGQVSATGLLGNSTALTVGQKVDQFPGRNRIEKAINYLLATPSISPGFDKRSPIDQLEGAQTLLSQHGSRPAAEVESA